MKFRSALLLGLVILFCDFMSKAWIHANVPLLHTFPFYPYGGIGVFKNLLGIQFSIVHTTNIGAAWGVLENWPNLLVAIRVVFVAILSFWVYYSKGKKILFPLTLIIAGALGNLVDFFVYGHVIDFLYFIFWGYPYPIFNLADSAIFIGVFMLFFKTYATNPSRSIEVDRGPSSP